MTFVQLSVVDCIFHDLNLEICSLSFLAQQSDAYKGGGRRDFHPTHPNTSHHTLAENKSTVAFLQGFFPINPSGRVILGSSPFGVSGTMV